MEQTQRAGEEQPTENKKSLLFSESYLAAVTFAPSLDFKPHFLLHLCPTALSALHTHSSSLTLLLVVSRLGPTGRSTRLREIPLNTGFFGW